MTTVQWFMDHFAKCAIASCKLSGPSTANSLLKGRGDAPRPRLSAFLRTALGGLAKWHVAQLIDPTLHLFASLCSGSTPQPQ